jgi:hypothetical protein
MTYVPGATVACGSATQDSTPELIDNLNGACTCLSGGPDISALFLFLSRKEYSVYRFAAYKSHQELTVEPSKAAGLSCSESAPELRGKFLPDQSRAASDD